MSLEEDILYKEIFKNTRKKKIEKKKFHTTEQKKHEIFLKLFKKCLKKIKKDDFFSIDNFFQHYIQNIKKLSQQQISKNFEKLKIKSTKNREILEKISSIEKIQIFKNHDQIIFKNLTKKIYPLFKIADFIWQEKKLEIDDLEICYQFHFFILGGILWKNFGIDLEFSDSENILKNLEVLEGFEVREKTIDLVVFEIFEYFLKHLENNFNGIFQKYFFAKKFLFFKKMRNNFFDFNEDFENDTDKNNIDEKINNNEFKIDFKKNNLENNKFEIYHLKENSLKNQLNQNSKKKSSKENLEDLDEKNSENFQNQNQEKKNDFNHNFEKSDLNQNYKIGNLQEKIAKTKINKKVDKNINKKKIHTEIDNFFSILKKDKIVLEKFKEFIFFFPNFYKNEITKKLFEIFLDIKIYLENNPSFEKFQNLLENINNGEFDFPFKLKEINKGIDFLLIRIHSLFIKQNSIS